MPLIKADDPRLADDLVVFDLGDLSAQAQHMMDDARKEARELYQKGYAEGRAAGQNDAMRQGMEMFERLQSAWLSALEQWEIQRQMMLDEARQSLVELAILLAEKVVRRMPAIDPTIVADQVTEALQHTAAAEPTVVRVHPTDRPLVERCLPRILMALAEARHIDIEDDPSIEPGGCVVTAGRGRIDATLNKQLQRIAERLLPARHEELEAA